MERAVNQSKGKTPCLLYCFAIQSGRMIESLRCKATRQLWETGRSRRFGSISSVALRKLAMLDAAESLEDLRVPPTNRLEILRGDRKGLCSIRVNDQWRVCFRWENGRVTDVEIVDYH